MIMISSGTSPASFNAERRVGMGSESGRDSLVLGYGQPGYLGAQPHSRCVAAYSVASCTLYYVCLHIIGKSKSSMTEIYLHVICAHYRSYVNACLHAFEAYCITMVASA